MEGSRVPERFLVAPYALGLCITVAVLSRVIETKRILQPVAAILVVYTISMPVRVEASRAVEAIASRDTSPDPDRRFVGALRLMHEPATILFAGSQSAPDYELFAPASHYSNTVVSWGHRPFDAGEMEKLIRERHIDYVLVENDQVLSFHWDPDIASAVMVKWLSEQTWLEELPLDKPRMRLFHVVRGG
jgi:hypothetical protein